MTKATPSIRGQAALDLVGSWSQDEIRDASQFLEGEREKLDRLETVGNFNPQPITLTRDRLDQESFTDSLREVKAFVGQDLFGHAPNMIKLGWRTLGLTQGIMPGFDDLDRQLHLASGHCLALIPQPPDLRLECACIVKGRIPCVPHTKQLDTSKRLGPHDIRQTVVGFLPLWVADEQYRKYVRALAGMILRTFDPARSILAAKLWTATVEQGVLRNGDRVLPYGRRLVTDTSLSAWACTNATTTRKQLDMKALQAVRLSDMNGRSKDCVIFYVNSIADLQDLLKAFLD